MWIKSQDGKILVDAKEIFIEEVYGKMIFCSTDSEDYLLGQYSTHEKALKVLDEIQVRISGMMHGLNECIGVHTMPKDDEVEV